MEYMDRSAVSKKSQVKYLFVEMPPLSPRQTYSFAHAPWDGWGCKNYCVKYSLHNINWMLKPNDLGNQNMPTGSGYLWAKKED